jgi:hypothetical protein
MKLKITWFLGGCAIAVLGGFNAAACSSSSSNPVTQMDSGMKPDTGGADVKTSMDTGPGTDGTSGETGPSDAGCGVKAPTLHSGTMGDLYCPFGPDGSTLGCGSAKDSGGACCISGEVGDAYPPSVCAATGTDTCSFTATTGNTTITCEDPATDCPSGMSCCAYGGHLKPDTNDTTGAVCSFDKYTDWAGTACASSCTGFDAGASAGTVLELCSSSSECGSGKTCVAFKAKGIDLGYCM